MNAQQGSPHRAARPAQDSPAQDSPVPNSPMQDGSAEDDEQAGLAAFNALDDDATLRALHRCCSSARWAAVVAAARPCPSVEALLAESDAAVAAMTDADLLEALAGHPRIGDRRVVAGSGRGTGRGRGTGGGQGTGGGRGAGWSRQEQAGVGAADEAMLRALADGNAAYERRFGHIYLACATGRSGAELLAFLRERLDNDRQTEWRVVAVELAKINQIRLRKLIGGQT